MSETKQKKQQTWIEKKNRKIDKYIWLFCSGDRFYFYVWICIAFVFLLDYHITNFLMSIYQISIVIELWESRFFLFFASFLYRIYYNFIMSYYYYLFFNCLWTILFRLFLSNHRKIEHTTILKMCTIEEKIYRNYCVDCRLARKMLIFHFKKGECIIRMSILLFRSCTLLYRL